MQAGKEEDRGNSLLQERPLITAPQQIFRAEVIPEVEIEIRLAVHFADDRFQIGAECRSENVQRVCVLGTSLFRNLFGPVRWMILIPSDHIHLKHGNCATEREQRMADIETAAEQAFLLSCPCAQ